MTVVGIDVGGERKGFHGCAIDGGRIVAGPGALGGVEAAAAWVASFAPTTIAIDSPCEPAPDGERSRPDEREFARAHICGIRWTPEEQGLVGPYYGWVVHGRKLYAELEKAIPGAEVIEVFPTAAWTVWHEKRGEQRRAAWTSAGLKRAGESTLDLTPITKPRLSQDDRDAVAAALVARQYEEDRRESKGEGLGPRTTAYGKIIVPAAALP